MDYDIYKLSDRIRNRLGMYVSEITLRSIASFFSGYIVAMEDDDMDAGESHFHPFYKFNSWIDEKYALGASAAGWQTTVLAQSLKCEIGKVGNEKFYKNISREQHFASVKLFFELLDEYRSETTQQS